MAAARPIERLRADVLEGGNDARHSPLWVYMRRHWAAMVQAREVEKVTYSVMAKWLGSEGLKDNQGKSPGARLTRRTYESVRAFMDARKEKEPQRPSGPREPRVRQPVQPEAPPERSGGGTVKDFSAEPEQPRRKFRRTAAFRGTEDVDGKA